MPLTATQKDQVRVAASGANNRADLTASFVAAKIPRSVFTGGGPLVEILDMVDVPESAPPFGQAQTLVGRGLDRVVDVGANAVIGAAKSAGGQVLRGGAWLRENVPGVQALEDATGGPWATVDPASLELEGTAQKVGATAEQVGEFFIPGVVGPKIAKRVPAVVRAGQRAYEGLSAGGITLAQGGTIPEAAASAGLAAVVPEVGRLASRVARPVRESAERSMAQSLAANTNAAKAEAAELAPQMLERGVGGTQGGLFRRSEQMVERIGSQIGAAVETARAAGTTVATAPLVAAMRQSRLASQGGVGLPDVLPGTEQIVRTLERLEEFLVKFGDTISIEKAQAIKQGWAQIVSKSGLYGAKADAAPTDLATAWAYREGAAAMRRAVGGASPTLDKLNKEFGFWKGLEDVLGATILRTQAQGPGLTQAITGSGGGVIVGAATQDVGLGLLGYAVTASVTRLLRSPIFRNKVSGPMKNALADALASGDRGRVLQSIATITSAFPSILGRAGREQQR